MSDYDSSVIERTKDLAPFERWKVELSYARKELKKFHKRGREVVKKYIDERDSYTKDSKWFNIFYANTEILQAALYSKVPRPQVSRKFTDYNDDIARVAANILQRCVQPDEDNPRDNFDAAMRHIVFDRLVPGLASVWLRLETDTEQVSVEVPVDPEPVEDSANGFQVAASPDTSPQMQTVEYERITDQRVCIDYVYWEDLLWSPCRVWAERRWVARRAYMTREELEDRFGDKGKVLALGTMKLPLANGDSANNVVPENQAMGTAPVWEIWDRQSRRVIWLSEDGSDILDEKDDFLMLVGFDPCPQPLLANTSTSNTVPRPDYYLIQDQYNELNTLNNRISLLVKACRVAGVYDQSANGVQRLLQEGGENVLIPVDNWALYAEKGGMKGQIDWLPLQQIADALQQLNAAREVTKQQIYELTGISDIVRGTTKASETLGAQQLKAQFASVRIKNLQDSVAKFVSETLRLKAEIMVKHFDPEVMKRKSNIMRTDDAQLADLAIQMLQSEEGFEWRIKIAPEELAQTDYAMQKQDRIELLTATGQYVSQIQGVMQAAPQMAPLFASLLKWAIAGFQGARDIEGVIDRELDKLIQIQQQQMQQQQNKPSPAEITAQESQAKLKMDQETHQFDMQSKAQEHQQDMAFKQQDAKLDLVTKLMKMQTQGGVQ